MFKISGQTGNQMFQFAYIYSQVLDGVLPDIYLQDPKYFDPHREEIQKLYGDNIGSLPYVAIHVRRADFLGSPIHTDVSATNYYERAVKLFGGKTFMIFWRGGRFSSPENDEADRQWCVKCFSSIGIDFKFTETTNEVDDFNTMASCEGIVMANSTFSWWASYVNPNPNKIIVTPAIQKWYKDGVIRTRVPSEWVQVDFAARVIA